jgi:hypothetical protein
MRPVAEGAALEQAAEQPEMAPSATWWAELKHRRGSERFAHWAEPRSLARMPTAASAKEGLGEAAGAVVAPLLREREEGEAVGPPVQGRNLLAEEERFWPRSAKPVRA